jgi:hypothetical protein
MAQQQTGSPPRHRGIMHLTYHDEAPKSGKPVSDSTDSAGAPEIEITPEMIAAGVNEIASYNLDFESREDAVARIYEAMFLASRSAVL